MENRKQLPHKKILKLLLATAVFYVGFFSFSKKAGEKIDYTKTIAPVEEGSANISSELGNTLELQTGSVSQKDNTIPNSQQQIHNNTFKNLKDAKHQAALTKLALLKKIKENKNYNPYHEKFLEVCEENPIYCKMIDFNHATNYQKQIIYLQLVKIIGDFMTEHQQYGKPILSVLKTIDVKNKKGSPRAYASWSKITMHEPSIGGFKEFFNLIGHEIGHVVDLGAIQGNSSKRHSLFTEFGRKNFALDDPSLEYYSISRIDEKTRKEDMDQVNFCSRYGMSNPFEDFAECHNLYLNHNNIFLVMAKHNQNMKAKYNFMANIYGGEYLFNDKDNSSKIAISHTWRVWDTTKLQKD